MHQCIRYLTRTVNMMVTDTGRKYIVYICEDCKRYYVRKGKGIFEVQYSHDQNVWKQIA